MRKELTDMPEVEIRAEWLEKLDRLQESKPGNPGVRWTPEMDEVLLRYWNKGPRQLDVAKIIGVNQQSCRERWKELTNE